MRPQTHNEAKKLCEQSVAIAKKYSAITTVICPAFVFLSDCKDHIDDNIALGAQDIFWEDEGAYTGEISPLMLKDNSVSYVLIGHSERRINLDETDEMINKKIHAALRNDITSILLIGEREREEPREDILIDQISRNLAGVSVEQISKMILCYEPSWAISSQKGSDIASSEHIESGVAIIRDICRKMMQLSDDQIPPVLYGGSVSAEHKDIISMPSLDGFVVGSQSLKPDGLEALLKSM